MNTHGAGGMSRGMFPISEVSGLDLAFPVSVEHMMPKYSEIPAEFKNGHTRWNKLVSAWFFSGIQDLKLTPREGVDQQKALRHIKMILGSFEPKHEHKEAGCAYLLDQWFSDAIWTASSKATR